MIGFLKILFYSYNNFVIPYEEINGKKVLVLNNAHALMCNDYNYYDNCLKLNYDFDTKEFTYRDDSLIRKKLNMPKLESFLLDEIKKYNLPCGNIVKIPNLSSIVILGYRLPKKKEIFSRIEELQNIINTTKQSMENVFKGNAIYESMILFYRKTFENSLSAIAEYQNISRKTRYSFVSSVLCDLTEFLLFGQENEKKFKLTDGKYHIWLKCTK